MKKTFLLILTGFVLHMLYLDLIVYKATSKMDKCLTDVSISKTEECDDVGTKTFDSHYLKYFGLFRLLKYDSVVPGNFKLE